jgi:LuxR family maltose regulon positive regulatory protein
LEQLERANLFIIPLDDEGRWYRYHHLFADLLGHRLQRLYPDLLPELHRRASAWYAQAGLVAEAIRHALAAGDVAGAVALIEEAAMTVLWHGQVSTMTSWLETLPAEVVRARPRLSLAQAWGLVLTGPIEAVEAHLQDVEQSLGETNKHASQPAAEGESLLGQVIALRALVALNQNDLGRAISLCQQALAHLPPDNTLVRGLIAYNLGHGERQSGHGDAASRAFGEAITLGQATGNMMLALYAATSLAELAEVQGQLHQAARTYQQALQLATGRDGQPLPLAGAAYVGLGKVWREWNDLAAAADHLTTGIELGRRGGVEGIILDGSITLALVRQAQGDGKVAHALIRQAAQLAQKWNQPATMIRVAAFEARLWLAQGQLEPALRWVRESGVSVDDEPREQLEIEHATLARILLAHGDWDEAQRLLDRLLPIAEAAGRLGRVIEILTLQALVFQGRGEFDPALFTLERALNLAEPEGYLRIFADEGAPMAMLFKRMKADPPSGGRGGRMKEYIHKLLAAFDAGEQGSTGAGEKSKQHSLLHPLPPAPLLVDPLSERELEVLRLIAEGLSNREIAEQLIISFGTVRKHVENIRSKLGVTSRLQAVNQARAWGLL